MCCGFAGVFYSLSIAGCLSAPPDRTAVAAAHVCRCRVGSEARLAQPGTAGRLQDRRFGQ